MGRVLHPGARVSQALLAFRAEAMQAIATALDPISPWERELEQLAAEPAADGANKAKLIKFTETLIDALPSSDWHAALEQIKTVCEDNAAETCNQRMALNFVYQITTTALSPPCAGAAEPSTNAALADRLESVGNRLTGKDIRDICSALRATPGAAEPSFALLEQALGEIGFHCAQHGKQPLEPIIEFIKRLAAPPVRGDREVALEHRVIPGREDWFLLAHELSEARDAYLNGMGQEGSAARQTRLREILWNDKGTFIQALQAMSLSPVQPGAGERLKLGDIVRANETFPHFHEWRNAEMKIVSMRVDPEGNQWVSVIEGSPRHRGNGAYDSETTDIKADWLSRQAPHSSSEDGR